jgi:hypothetical protein
MRPWQQAKKWLIDNNGETFESQLGHYMNYGYVWSGDKEFIMAQKVRVDGERLQFGHPEPDCWFVGLASGTQALARFLELAPEPLPYVSWARRGQDDNYHIYKWDDYQRRVRKWEAQK